MKCNYGNTIYIWNEFELFQINVGGTKRSYNITYFISTNLRKIPINQQFENRIVPIEL